MFCLPSPITRPTNTLPPSVTPTTDHIIRLENDLLDLSRVCDSLVDESHFNYPSSPSSYQNTELSNHLDLHGYPGPPIGECVTADEEEVIAEFLEHLCSDTTADDGEDIIGEFLCHCSDCDVVTDSLHDGDADALKHGIYDYDLQVSADEETCKMGGCD